MKEGQPAFLGAHGGRSRAKFIIGEGHIFDPQHQLGVAPVAQIGRIGAPDIEAVDPAAPIDWEGPFQTHVFAADPLRKEHHVTVIRGAEAENLEMLEILGHRDPAANSVAGVDREAHGAAPIDNRQARVVTAADFAVAQIETGFGLHLPMEAVVTEGQPQVGVQGMRRGRMLAVVVAEDHHVAPLEAGHPGVEDQQRLERHIFGRQNRVAWVAADASGRFEFSHRGKNFPDQDIFGWPERRKT